MKREILYLACDKTTIIHRFGVRIFSHTLRTPNNNKKKMISMCSFFFLINRKSCM